MSRPHEFPMPTSLGKYQLIRELGSGAMGVVWEAVDTVLDRRVAIKILSDDGELSAVHIREAAVAARVNHPNAVAVYDAGEFEGRRFIVMELVAGPNAGRLVAERGRLPWAEATRIARDAASGLAAIHCAGLIHRDVKPGNILIAPDGSAKVADFGLAKRSTIGGLTKVTGVVGTPHYMSPEQCWSELADARADLYSLGATLYTLLTGRPPYDGDTEMAVMYAHCNSPVPDPRAIANDIPNGCAAVIRRAMAKLPAERFASAAEMRTALDELSKGMELQSAEPARNFRLPPRTIVRARLPRRSLRRVSLLLIAAAMAGIAATAVALRWPTQHGAKSTEPRVSDDLPNWVGSWFVEGEVQQLACSPDGLSVGVTVDRKDGSGEVQLRTLDGRMRAWGPKFGAGADGIAFSPDGRFLAVAFRIWQRVQVYELASGREVFDEAVPFASSIAFSSDGNWLAVGGYTHEGARVRVWNRKDGGSWLKQLDFETAESYIWGFAFAPDSAVLAVAAGAGPTDAKQAGLYLWDVSTGRDAPGPKVKLSRVDVGPTVAFAGAAPILAVSSFGEIFSFRTTDWQPAGPPLKFKLNDASMELRTMAFSPDGKWLAGGRDRDLHLWRMEDGLRVDHRGFHDDTLHAVAFTPDSRRLLTGGKDGKVTVREPAELFRE